MTTSNLDGFKTINKIEAKKKNTLPKQKSKAETLQRQTRLSIDDRLERRQLKQELKELGLTNEELDNF